jgi:hypothetical protein
VNRPPVLLFAFNRPKHLARLLESISLNEGFEEFNYFIFIDGPRNIDDKLKIEEIRNLIDEYNLTLKIEATFSTENYGVRTSLQKNISYMFSKYEEVIVLEDDLVISRNFLQFMVKALSHFRDIKSCSSISGYRYDLKNLAFSPYVLLGGDCWGWATWRDRWNNVIWEPKKLMNSLQKSGRLNEFDIQGKYKYSSILKDQISGTVDSWAIQWHGSMFLLDKFTYYPQISLCKNMGNDGSGTHFGKGSKYNVDMGLSDINLLDFPLNFYNAEVEFEKFHSKNISERIRAPFYTLRRKISRIINKVGK